MDSWWLLRQDWRRYASTQVKISQNSFFLQTWETGTRNVHVSQTNMETHHPVSYFVFLCLKSSDVDRKLRNTFFRVIRATKRRCRGWRKVTTSMTKDSSHAKFFAEITWTADRSKVKACAQTLSCTSIVPSWGGQKFCSVTLRLCIEIHESLRKRVLDFVTPYKANFITPQLEYRNASLKYLVDIVNNP